MDPSFSSPDTVSSFRLLLWSRPYHSFHCYTSNSTCSGEKGETFSSKAIPPWSFVRPPGANNPPTPVHTCCSPIKKGHLLSGLGTCFDQQNVLEEATCQFQVGKLVTSHSLGWPLPVPVLAPFRLTTASCHRWANKGLEKLPKATQ